MSLFVSSYESDRSSRYSKSRSARNSLERDKRDRDRERDGDREREKEVSRNKEKERDKTRDLSPVPEDVVKPKSQGNFHSHVSKFFIGLSSYLSLAICNFCIL